LLLKGSSILLAIFDSSFLENSAAGLLLDNEVLALYESQTEKILFLYQFIFF
jgi:hypothetical protein